MIFIIIYIYLYLYLCIYTPSYIYIHILKPSQCRNSIPRQVFCPNFSRRIQMSLLQSHARLFVSPLFMIFIIIYIHSYLYLCIYTPSYPHFKAFPVSKFNSETSFLYQLFKKNSNFIVFKPRKVIYLSIFYYFHYYYYYYYYYYLYLFICLFMHLYTFISTF